MNTDQVLKRIRAEQARQAQGKDAAKVCYANGLAQELSDKATQLALQTGVTIYVIFCNLCKRYDFVAGDETIPCCIIYNPSTLQHELWLGYFPEPDPTTGRYTPDASPNS